jgi:hypothetical protein
LEAASNTIALSTYMSSDGKHTLTHPKLKQFCQRKPVRLARVIVDSIMTATQMKPAVLEKADGKNEATSSKVTFLCLVAPDTDKDVSYFR